MSDQRPVPYDERYRCTATSKRTRERCRSRAVPGSMVCKIHGGGSPQARQKAAWRLEEQRIQSELGRLVHELELDPRHPEEALLDTVNRMDAMMRILGIRATEDGVGPDSGWLRLYLQAVKDTHALAAKVADLRLDERRVVVDEERAEIMATFVRLVLEELGVDLLDPKVQAIVRRRLHALPTSAGELGPGG